MHIFNNSLHLQTITSCFMGYHRMLALRDPIMRLVMRREPEMRDSGSGGLKSATVFLYSCNNFAD